MPWTTAMSHNPSVRARTLLANRHGGVWIFYAAFLGVSSATRVALLLRSASSVSFDGSLLGSFALGFLFDLGTAAFASLPFVLLLTLLPARALVHRPARWLAHAALFLTLYLLLLGAVAEWTFWEEFGTRFNFIAVDYLVYTTEVLGNIRESYPLPLILGVLVPTAGLLHAAICRAGWMKIWLSAEPQRARSRWVAGAAWSAAAIVLGLALSQDRFPAFRNNYNREIAKNGLWSLFAAFRENVLDYDTFYNTMAPDAAFERLREELVEDRSILLRPAARDTLRYVQGPGDELRPNVIQLTVESLSAEFLGAFNPDSTLTPNLDALARESLLFDSFYATGTRTDRGMEALTLSLPPTPGRSLVKRPRNEDLFTLGSLFRAKGYDTAFLYGGFGYFDNMNYFFGHNGYRVIDRSSVAADDISFSNVWGACDEDLYRWTLREADRAHAGGRPFHFFVMTTSNHRPFTYPDGKIDLPPKVSGRRGAVKYTDYAIGEFLRDASSRPWFRDTVFVVVADHCASSAGKTEIPVENYHIPLLIYAPGGQIAAGRISTLTSQMDYAPTLLGLLRWSYPSRFLGHDVRRIEEKEAHALLGSYQKLGHLENGSLVVLQPMRGEATYRVDLATGKQNGIRHDNYAEQETIAYFQVASYLYQHELYKALSATEYAQAVAAGETLAAAAAPPEVGPGR